MPNFSVEDYQNAISALKEYQETLLEISDFLASTIANAKTNIPNDDHMKEIDEKMQKEIIQIHQTVNEVKKVQKQLARELEIITTK